MKKIINWVGTGLFALSMLTGVGTNSKNIDQNNTKKMFKQDNKTNVLYLEHANNIYSESAIGMVVEAHYSHSSHQSHYSHRSHYSHYSGV